MSKTRRLELSNKLREILGTDNVYFQPPNNTKIKYPCIIYNKEKPSHISADDFNYFYQDKYEILVIDKDPDSDIAENLVEAFQYMRINRHFVKDNLNQTQLTLYY